MRFMKSLSRVRIVVVDHFLSQLETVLILRCFPTERRLELCSIISLLDMFVTFIQCQRHRRRLLNDDEMLGDDLVDIEGT